MPFDFKPVFDRALPYDRFLARYATPDQREKWARIYDAATLTPEQQTLLTSFRRKMPVLCLAGAWCGDCVNACPILQRFAEAAPAIDLRFINRPPSPPSAPSATPATATSAPSADPDDIRNRPIGKWLVRMGVLTPERVEKALLLQEEQKAQGINIRIGDVMRQAGMITEAQLDEALAAQSGQPSLAEADALVARELTICGGSRVPVVVFLSEEGNECARFGDRTLATYRQKAAQNQGATCSTGLFAPPTDLLAANIAEWLAHFERIQLMLQTSPRLMRLHGEA